MTDPIARRPKGESIVPMINVVFLLLIFFLMTSQLTPPEPFEIETPNAQGGTDTQAQLTLYVDQSGQLAFEDLTGQAAISSLAALAGDTVPVMLRADGRLSAVLLTGILKQLGEAGLAKVEIAVVPQ